MARGTSVIDNLVQRASRMPGARNVGGTAPRTAYNANYTVAPNRVSFNRDQIGDIAQRTKVQTRERQMFDYKTSKQANKIRGRQNTRDIAMQREAQMRQQVKDKPLMNQADHDQVRKVKSKLDQYEAKNRKRERVQTTANRSQNSTTANSNQRQTVGSRTDRKHQVSSGVSPTTATSNDRATIGSRSFLPGRDPSKNLTEQGTKTLGTMRHLLGDNLGEHGRMSTHLMRTAGQGAVWGGAIGGATSMAQGGDFWEGAKEGAFKGAVGWTGVKTAKLATGADRYRDIPGKAKEIWQHHSVSKPVQSINTLRNNVRNSPTNM